MSLEIKYRGRTIRFREDDETWHCDDLCLANYKSFTAIKRKIDDLTKSERRINVRALMFNGGDYFGGSQIEEVTVTVLCEPEKERYGNEQTIHCWVKSKEGRTKVRLERLVPIENRAELQRWVTLGAEAEAARKKAADHLESIPRHDADSLMLAAKEEKARPHE